MNIPLIDRLTGTALVLVVLMVLLSEWHLVAPGGPVLAVLMLALVALLSMTVAANRRAFVLAAAGLTAALAYWGHDWQAYAIRGLGSAAFIGAFFSALATLRSAAQTAPAIAAGGTFLAEQPPGRRYLALTVGGQMFALLLNYGAIALLGALATASAREEPDAEIRMHRTRRMLLAIQRGFISTLPWSPMSFAVAITTSVVPGTSWGAVVVPGILSSLIMAGIGWGLDTAFKPRLTRGPMPRAEPHGSWALLLPLVALLVILGTSVAILQALTGLRVVALVLLVVPVIAISWTVLQARRGGQPLRRRAADFAFRELPGYRGEITLLMMAGYIGTVGAPLLAPLVEASGFHPEVLPTWIVLVAFVWLVPLAGQFAMNPILAVTLIAPLIPPAPALGVPPAAIVTAITSGWALSGISSPFTATTLLVGSFGNVSARHVGLRWNGMYLAVLLVVMPLWVLGFAWVAG